MWTDSQHGSLGIVTMLKPARTIILFKALLESNSFSLIAYVNTSVVSYSRICHFNNALREFVSVVCEIWVPITKTSTWHKNSLYVLDWLWGFPSLAYHVTGSQWVAFRLIKLRHSASVLMRSVLYTCSWKPVLHHFQSKVWRRFKQ